MNSPEDDEESVVPHQFTLPMLLKMAEAGTLKDDTTLAPVGHIQLTMSASSITPDQNRFWLDCASIGSTLK